MNKTIWIVLLACAAAVTGVAAQAPVVAPDGAGDEAVPAQVLGIDTHWIGEREILHIRVLGDGVSAGFSSVDASTCEAGIETTVHVQGSVGTIDARGSKGSYHIESNVVTVVVEVFDRCLNMPILSVFGTGPADQLQLNPNLKSANLRASFAGMDDSGNPIPISVDLVWNGAGGRDRTSDHTSLSGVFHFETNSTGTIRETVAGGSVVVGGLDVTPLPSVEGVIETNSTRRLMIYR